MRSYNPCLTTCIFSECALVYICWPCLCKHTCKDLWGEAYWNTLWILSDCVRVHTYTTLPSFYIKTWLQCHRIHNCRVGYFEGNPSWCFSWSGVACAITGWLTHCGLVMPDGPTPLPEAMLTCHRKNTVVFTWGHCHLECSRYEYIAKSHIYNYYHIPQGPMS